MRQYHRSPTLWLGCCSYFVNPRGLTLELSGRARLPDAVPDADYNLAATGTARGPDTVRLNERLGHNG